MLADDAPPPPQTSPGLPFRPLGVALFSLLAALLVLWQLPAPEFGSPQNPPLITQHSSNTIADSSPADPITLEDVTIDWQVFPLHRQTAERLASLPESLGSGLCVADFNGDGWMDLFFIGGSGHTRHYGGESWWQANSGNRLLLNRQGLLFEDRTSESGLTLQMVGMGCAAADLDNDGAVDLVVTAKGGIHLYRNLGNAQFEDHTVSSGLLQGRWSTGVSIGDVNRDGLPDLYVSNYLRFNRGQRTFERHSGYAIRGAEFDPTLYDPEPNQLYLNQSNLRFSEVAAQYGVSNDLGRSLGARWLDLNHDGWLDLVVLNDLASPSRVFINQAGQGFARGGADYALLEQPGVHDMTPLYLDQQPSLMLSRGLGFPPVLLQHTRADASTPAGWRDLAWNLGLADTQRLYPALWGLAAADLNNDGHTDLYAASGTTYPDMHASFMPQGQANWLWQGLSGGRVALQQSVQAAVTSSRAAVTADLDNDGQLELIVSNNNDPLQILRNRTPGPNHWLGLDLLSANPLSTVVGTRIELRTEQGTLTRLFQLPSGYLSQGDHRLHLGLGSSQQLLDLTLYWPDGSQTLLQAPPLDRYLVIDKTQGRWQPAPRAEEPLRPFSSQIAELEPTARHYLSLALVRAEPAAVYPQLRQLWPQLSPASQRQLLQMMDARWGFRSLPFIRQALAAEDQALRLTAIAKLRRAETEFGVVLLLPQLNHRDPATQCAAARAFQFFFEEEEAVIQRKALAVPELIRLLSESLANPFDASSQVCAIDALAAAENLSAVQTLLQLALQSPTQAVQVAAIRALGLIRDPAASAPLLTLARNSTSPPALVAASLIALKRLQADELQALLEQLLSPGNNRERSRQLALLSALQRNPENGAFQRSQMQVWLQQLLATLPLQHTPPDQRTQLLQLLLGLQMPLSPEQLAALQSETDPARRALLWAIQLQQGEELTALSTESIPTLNALLSHSQGVVGRLSNATLAEIAARYSQYYSNTFSSERQGQAPSTALAQQLQALPPYSRRQLLQHLLKQPLHHSTLPLLQLCQDPAIYLPLAESSPLEQLPSELHLAYTRCLINQPLASDSYAALKRRALLNLILGDRELNPADQFTLSLQAAEQDPVVLDSMLLSRFAQLSAAQQRQVLQLLEQQDGLQPLQSGLHKGLQALLQQRMRSEQEPLSQRLESAMYLMAFNDPETLAYLESLVGGTASASVLTPSTTPPSGQHP